MNVNVVFVIRCLYSTVILTLVKEERFIRIIICYYYDVILGLLGIRSFLLVYADWKKGAYV